ncbi:MAG TPA: gamma-glutamylcyclotransferase [Dehalococcoidia bacterium]|nr:gamma-glutamylcyclotransferase [Dehalococcoidia bacterium]
MHYFAYASNLNRKQMAERCPDSKPKFIATLPNYKLIFTGWSRQWQGGVASIKPFRGDKVIGAVYEVSETDLKLLDKYEGYPIIYNRLNVIVWTDAGDHVEAMTYIKIEQSQEAPPSREYLAVIQQGYRDWEIV